MLAFTIPDTKMALSKWKYMKSWTNIWLFDIFIDIYTNFKDEITTPVDNSCKI